jgi:hypothetical protein
MAVNLSPVGGVAAQFFDNAGNVLTGGKLYTYAAGTTTPQTAYTTSAGNVPWSNPIILDAAGRVSGSGEIWLTDGTQYKFILRDSNDVLIATYDNVIGINSNFVNFTNEQEIQTATAGQTVFNLTTTTYSPGTNSLSVFVDGVNQYGPGAQYAYIETDADTVTFVNGLHVGALVKFTTSQLNSSSGVDAFQVSYTPPFTGSVGTNVGDKLAQTVSVQDFGAVGDGVTNDTAAFTAAGSANAVIEVNVPAGTYLLSSSPAPTGSVTWVIDKGASFTGSGVLSDLTNKIVSRGDYQSIESDPSFYNGIFGYLEQNAAQTNYGTIAVHGSVQSAGGTGVAGEADIAIAAFGANNLNATSGGVWGLYSTVLRASGANGATHGMEIDVANFGSTVSLFPSTPFTSGLTSGIWCCTGGETTEPSAGGSPGIASVGLAIIQNDSQVVKTAKFDKGILFHNAAINGADGTGGANLGIAIAFATGHAMQWFNNSNQICAEIVNTGATFASTNMRMDFANGGINFQDRLSGVVQLSIENTTGIVNFANATVTAGAGAQAGFFQVKINNTLFKVPYFAL